MENKTTSINILGCCVLRDTFGMHPNNGGYIIKRFVQTASPVSLVTKSPMFDRNTEIKNDIFLNEHKFTKRNQELELKKQVFEYLKEDPAEFLVIDCAEFRHMLLYFTETDGWFTESYTSLLKRYSAEKIVPENFSVIDPLEIEKEKLYTYLKCFCEKLLSLYDREHIILFEIKAIDFHTDGNNINVFYGKHEIAELYNKRMKIAFDYVKHYLKGCHVVEFPHGVIGDTNHKWKKALLHYVPEYYDYSKKAVDIITSNLGNRCDEKMALEFLKHNYEKLFLDKYGEILRNFMEKSGRERQKYEKILKYEQFFKQCLIENGKEKILNSLVKEEIKSCAFYGRTQITYVLFTWFRSWNIEIKFVIENYSSISEWEGIHMIKRDDISSLDVENIIICDLNDVAVKEKLRNAGFNGKIISYKELI